MGNSTHTDFNPFHTGIFETIIQTELTIASKQAASDSEYLENTC